MIEKWIAGLTGEQAKEELLKLHAKYDDRGSAMRDAGDIVRSLYVCCKCGKRILDVGAGYCHCTRVK